MTNVKKQVIIHVDDQVFHQIYNQTNRMRQNYPPLMVIYSIGILVRQLIRDQLLNQIKDQNQ